MALVTSRSALSQGTENIVASGVVFAAGTGADIEINDGAGGTLPVLLVDDFFEVRDHSVTNNNGLYQVVTVTTSTETYQCNKVSGSLPSTASAEGCTFLGDTSDDKDVFFDTAALKVYLLETAANALDADGVTGQAIYSFMMQEWKDDNFLIANAPFPMLAIDSDAGKYIMGQDASGNYSGWNWADDADISLGTFDIRTRKLLRNMGWNEVNAAGAITSRQVGVVTLGAFEDETPLTGDLAYFQFGNDTVVDDTVDFDFTGPVNEAVEFYSLIGDLSGDTPAFASTTTITRTTGSFITDGFKKGGQITIIGSTSNDGDYVLDSVAATTMTISTTWTAESWGSTQVAVNNDNAMTLKLRVRDGDTNGKTFGQANLASAGKTALGNFVYAFPLANATDLKIGVADIGIDANSDGAADVSPYSGMSITYYATPQLKSGLVGGDKNFGIIIQANDGTSEEVYEFVQWSLRSTGGNGTGDIDADGDTAIGRTMDGLMRFVGDTLEVGSTDGGLTFPYNPDGGGTGVFIEGLNASSKNDVKFFDNTQPATSLKFPETIPITLDFNATLEGDTAAEGDLFYDRTVRTTTDATFVITAVSGDTGTFTSTAQMPTLQNGVGAYVRVSGLTGGDAVMNGVYQVTTETSTSAWNVTRYDSADIVTTTGAVVNLDENCIDTPDAIIVHTDVKVSAATISFTAPDTISDSGNGLGVFSSGERIEIENSTSGLNDGVYTIDTVAAGSIALIEQTISTQGASPTIDLTEVVSVVATTDFAFSYDFDGNVQGGRDVSTTTYVKAKAIGQLTAQYTESTVQTIATGTPLTIPLVSQQERNVV